MNEMTGGAGQGAPTDEIIDDRRTQSERMNKECVVCE